MFLSATIILACHLAASHFVHALPGPTPASSADPPNETIIRGNDITSDLLPPSIINKACYGDIRGNATEVRINFDTGIHTINGNCPPFNATEGASAEFLSPPGSRIKLAQRGGCNYPPNTCQNVPGGWGVLGFARCNYQCEQEFCYEGGNGPNPNECQDMFNYFQSRNDQLIKLGPNEFSIQHWGSCATGVHNTMDWRNDGCASDMLYDFTSWASHGGSLAWGCQWPNKGGRCVSLSSNFYLHVWPSSEG